MRKMLIRVVALVGVLGAGQALATTGELRTPLARFPFHYQLTPVDDGLWSFNTFADCYMRTADKGFDVCNGTKKVPLAKLFFGKDTFTGEEAFAGGAIPSGVTAPAELRYINMHPRFSYTEKGVNFAVETEKRWDDSKWRVGGQLSIPFKVIELERNVCSATMTETSTGYASAVCRQQQTLYLAKTGLTAREDGQSPLAMVPAYRLDFLSSLCRASGAPMVEYGIQATQGSVRIAGIEVAKPQTAGGEKSDVAVLYSANGVCPDTPYYACPTDQTGALTDPDILGISQLQDGHYVKGDGTLNGAGIRGAFVTNQDYTNTLKTNQAAQSHLYVVPVYNSKPGDAALDTEFTTQAVIIMNAIEAAISDLETNGAIKAEQWFYKNGVHFCQTERNVGLGDMDLDLYVGYDFTKKFWGKLIAGVVFPTGKKICDPGLLLAQPTGNNGHFEIKLGAALGWKCCSWFGWNLDASYNFVLEANEWRGAPFKGAIVKNIGPKVQAKTKWGYFTGHLDMSVFHPENQNLGFTLGYEPYVKVCDKVKLCTTKLAEFPIKGCCGSCPTQNATEKELDACILAKDTKRVSHKIRGEVFHRWSYCEIFGGASSVVAGKNIMKETECHIGFGIFW